MKLSTKILVAILLWVVAQTVVAQSLNKCERIADQIDASCNSPTEICDPCYKLQWHLKNTGQNAGSTTGTDINIEPVWKKGNLGQGIVIGIIDNEIHDHEDLRENLSIEYSHDYYPNTTSTSSHGVSVAGIAAARANRIGIRGVAPRATFYILNITSGVFTEDKHVVNAMVRYAPITAVANRSGGPPNFETRGGDAWEMAIETGISKGFYGKGTVYVFSAGNFRCGIFGGRCGVESANYNGNANYHAVIAVGAVNDLDKVSHYSERGANLWLCAPSDDTSSGSSGRRPGIWTVLSRPSSMNRYTTIGGTSGAAPIVSGVVALMRHANPDLTWRDVKLILANSARRNNPTDKGWHAGATKLGAFTERYYFNRKCGFGVVDAHAAVSLAEQWVNLPPRVADTVTKTRARTLLSGGMSSSLNIQSDIDFIEYVDIDITLSANRWYELDVHLISPSGTKSRLIIPLSSNLSPDQHSRLTGDFPGRWRFGSAKHLGEDPSGTWQLVIDKNNTNHFNLKEWELRIRGYKVTMDAVTEHPLVEADIKEDAINSSLSLSLAGAKWRPKLQTSDFKLIDAPPGLRIASVSSGTRTVQLTFALEGEGFADDHQFQVEASTGTVSNLNRALLSNKIEILSNKPTVKKTILAPDAAVGLRYRYKIPVDTFKSAEALTYEISGEVIPGLSINPKTLRISGIPTASGTYRVAITTSTQDGNSTTTSFALRVRPRGYPIVVNPIPHQVLSIGEQLRFTNLFEDSDDKNSTLTYILLEAPHWVKIDEDGILTVDIPGHGTASGEYRIKIRATDKENKLTETFLSLNVMSDASPIQLRVFLEGLLE